jgi:hypothetical protein
MEVPALAFASTLNACEHHDTTRQNFSKENYFASYVRASRINKPKVVMHTSPKPQPRTFRCLLPSISRSRAMVADVALRSTFARLKGLRLDGAEPVRIGGWAFRGLLNLPVIWDAA